MYHLIDLVETNLFLGLLPTDYGNISDRLIPYVICDIKPVNHILNRWYSLHISSNILWIYDPWWFMAMYAIFFNEFCASYSRARFRGKYIKNHNINYNELYKTHTKKVFHQFISIYLVLITDYYIRRYLWNLAFIYLRKHSLSIMRW